MVSDGKGTTFLSNDKTFEVYFLIISVFRPQKVQGWAISWYISVRAMRSCPASLG